MGAWHNYLSLQPQIQGLIFELLGPSGHGFVDPFTEHGCKSKLIYVHASNGRPKHIWISGLCSIVWKAVKDRAQVVVASKLSPTSLSKGRPLNKALHLAFRPQRGISPRDLTLKEVAPNMGMMLWRKYLQLVTQTVLLLINPSHVSDNPCHAGHTPLWSCMCHRQKQPHFWKNFAPPREGWGYREYKALGPPPFSHCRFLSILLNLKVQF